MVFFFSKYRFEILSRFDVSFTWKKQNLLEIVFKVTLNLFYCLMEINFQQIHINFK